MSIRIKEESKPLEGEILPPSSNGTGKELGQDTTEFIPEQGTIFPCDILGSVNMAISPRALTTTLRSLGVRSVNFTAHVTRIGGLRVVSLAMKCEMLGASDKCLSEIYQVALRAMSPGTQSKK